MAELQQLDSSVSRPILLIVGPQKVVLWDLAFPLLDESHFQARGGQRL